MGYRFTDFPHMLHRAPDELERVILGAVRECAGNVRNAAEYVGLTRRQFYKYATAANLLDKIQEIRDEFRFGRVSQPRVVDMTEFGTLARADPESAKRVMKLAFDNSTSAPEAATALGISAKRFYAYARQWNLFPELQKSVARRMATRRDWLARRESEKAPVQRRGA